MLPDDFSRFVPSLADSAFLDSDQRCLCFYFGRDSFVDFIVL
jgi:hypothetical protein